MAASRDDEILASMGMTMAEVDAISAACEQGDVSMWDSTRVSYGSPLKGGSMPGESSACTAAQDVCAAVIALHGFDRAAWRGSDLKRVLRGSCKAFGDLVAGSLLVEAAPDVYVYTLRARDRADVLLFEIASALRRGEFLYESFGSAAAKAGIISQVVYPLTLATDGQNGAVDTPFGEIKFTHVDDAAAVCCDPRRSLARKREGVPLASEEVILRDLAASGAYQDLIDEEAGRVGDDGR